MKRPRAVLAAVITLFALALPPSLLASQTTAQGRGGAVVSAEPASTEVGLEILRRGGNAADAAVATALAMAVVHPQAGNLGGGGFALTRFAGEVESLDFRETAPRAATRDMYVDSGGQPRRDAALVGPLASGVPGTPAGLETLHRRFGSLPWSEVVEPARRLAAAGFIVSDRLSKSVELERELLSRFPETASVWLPGGEAPLPGTRMRLPDLARTLQIYGEQGAAGIQRGEVASKIIAAVRRHSGILDAADLAGYRPQWRPALEFDSFGWHFAAMDLPSSGGYLLAATLRLLEHLGWQEQPRTTSLRAHLLVETWRRVFADRTQLGDPSSTRVASAELMQPARLERLASGIDRNHTTPSARLQGWPQDLPTATLHESDETVHLSIIDGDGNVVALTTTLNGTFGCGLLVAGAGLFLNNEMDDFTTAPGHPNMFGLVQGTANEVAAGRRMLSSMVPTIGWRGDEIITLGGRGGSRIPTAVAQVLLNALVDDDELAAAVARPRVHHQWLPDAVSIEYGALTPPVLAELEKLGHSVAVSSRRAKVNAIRKSADGTLTAVGDPRGPASGGVVETEASAASIGGGPLLD